MAEALGNYLAPRILECYSAGTHPTQLRKETKIVLAEIGIDTKGLKSKGVDLFLNKKFDFVVTTCDSAREACPFFPGAKKTLHWSLPDPSQIQGDEAFQFEGYRQIRENLRQRILSLAQELSQQT